VTTEDLYALESKMLAAKEALLTYTEQKTALDRDRYRRLVERVKRSEAKFLAALYEAR
jgi:hypothetical protein